MTPTHTYYSPAVGRAEKLGTEWMAQARCAGQPVAVFFPVAANNGTAPDYGPALALCGDCPVVEACRRWATVAGEIVDGHAMHGQVVGGCAPAKPRTAGAKEPAMVQCYLDTCAGWFAKRPQGANMYCSKECAGVARRDSRARAYSRRRAAS